MIQIFIFLIISGLILANGDINWQCPCLGGMASGPCGVEFREAFSCFHFSEADPKGSDCYEPFRVMQDCMSKYPDLYDSSDDKDKSTPTDISETPSSGDASEQVTPTSDSSNNNSKSDSTTSEAVTKS